MRIYPHIGSFRVGYQCNENTCGKISSFQELKVYPELSTTSHGLDWQIKLIWIKGWNVSHMMTDVI